jgi:hypothetical protein
MKLLNELRQPVEDIDFGIVEAGHTKTLKYFIVNDSEAELIDLLPEVSNQEVKIVSCPKTIQSNSEGIIELSWNPSITIKKGLKTTIELSGHELYK